MGQAVEAAALADQRPGVKLAELQFVEVKDAPRLGISSQEDVKAAVEAEAVHQVRSHPAADAVGRLQDAEADAALGEPQTTTEARQARPDDQHVRFRHRHSLTPPVSA